MLSMKNCLFIFENTPFRYLYWFKNNFIDIKNEFFAEGRFTTNLFHLDYFTQHDLQKQLRIITDVETWQQSTEYFAEEIDWRFTSCILYAVIQIAEMLNQITDKTCYSEAALKYELKKLVESFMADELLQEYSQVINAVKKLYKLFGITVPALLEDKVAGLFQTKEASE